MSGSRFLTAGLAMVACSGFAAWSLAQAPGRPQQGGGFDPAAIFRRLDTNGDGTLTMTEVPQNERGFAERLFQMGGKTTTGSLTRAEFMEIAERHRNGGAPPPRGPNTPPRQPAGQPPEERDATPDDQLPPVLQSFDANRDQRLTRSELTRFVRQFEQLDTNGDGALDVAELSVSAPETAGEADTANSGTGSDRSSPAAGGSPRTRASGSSGTGRPGTRSGARSSSGARPEGNTTNVAGVWRGWVVNGRGERPNAGPLQMELRIEGQTMSARELGNNNAANAGLGTGTFQLTGTGNSGNLDALGTSGRHDGVDYLGIFEVDGDTLRWCVGNNGRPRPTEFATGRGNYFMILQRESN